MPSMSISVEINKNTIREELDRQARARIKARRRGVVCFDNYNQQREREYLIPTKININGQSYYWDFHTRKIKNRSMANLCPYIILWNATGASGGLKEIAFFTTGSRLNKSHANKIIKAIEKDLLSKIVYNKYEQLTLNL